MSFKLSCSNPIYIKKTNLIVPCGKCINCRRKYQLSWVVRLQHQYISSNQKALFLTLTYNDDNLPLNSTLVKKDIQDFMKRYRKHYNDIRIKYFAVGEYGSKTMRPHYHIIIFGINSFNSDFLNMRMANMVSRYIWKKGFCHIGDVNEKTIRYCSKYIMKEFVKGYNKNDFDKAGMVYPFSLKSTGLGLHYLLSNYDYIKEQILNDRPISLYKTKIGYPRYYRKKILEFGDVEEDYFLNNYKNYMDLLGPSIKSELNAANIPFKYDNISLYSYFNIEREKKLVRYPHKFSLKKRYLSDISMSLFKYMPYSDEEIKDIQENHWFKVYLDYYNTNVTLKRKENLIKNWKDSDYE